MKIEITKPKLILTVYKNNVFFFFLLFSSQLKTLEVNILNICTKISMKIKIISTLLFDTRI